MSVIPCFANWAASSTVTDGFEVEQSMMSNGLPAAASPSGSL